MVDGERLRGFADVDDAALLQQARPGGHAFDEQGVVRHQDDGDAELLELAQLVQALALERLVTHREGLVDEDDLGVEVHRDRDAEPHVHARRVVADGHVDEALELGEGDDRVEARLDVASREAVQRCVEEDVLAPGQVGAEARAQFQQRGDATS